MPVNVGSAAPVQGDTDARIFDGLCTIGLIVIVIGVCAVRSRRFAMFNALGAAIWEPLVVGLG